MPFDDEWFKSLFGPEPHAQKSERDLREDVKKANAHLLWAESRLEERLSWAWRRDGAMSAWWQAEAIPWWGSETRQILLRILGLSTADGSTPALAEKVAELVKLQEERLRRTEVELSSLSAKNYLLAQKVEELGTKLSETALDAGLSASRVAELEGEVRAWKASRGGGW